MRSEVAGRSEVFEVGDISGDTLALVLNAIVKLVSFGDEKSLWSEMALENSCKVVVGFLQQSFWRAEVQKDVISFGTDDRY